MGGWVRGFRACMIEMPAQLLGLFLFWVRADLSGWYLFFGRPFYIFVYRSVLHGDVNLHVGGGWGCPLLGIH